MNMNMTEARMWAIEAKELVEARQRKERAVQSITYGGKTIQAKKGKTINFLDFIK